MSHAIGLFGPDRRRADELRLGHSDYSYHFVMKYFAAALADVLPVVVIDDPRELGATDITSIAFVPPHKLPQQAGPRTYCAYAWEYDTIPTEVWNDDDRNDWRRPLGRVGGSIVHSQYAYRSVSSAMPAGHRLCSAPAPVWDRYAGMVGQAPPGSWSLDFTGWLLDSREAGLERGFALSGVDFIPSPRTVTLDGVVYTCVVNPDDGRKNWVDAMSAFTEAFRDNPDVTLLLKLVHHDPQRAGLIVADMIYRAAPYRCRVVALFGYLPDEQYRRMIAGSSFVVNSSRGEGQCLPLMEFMSAGVPAIAPDHTAMAEYVHGGNAFVVSTFQERTHWPHDPRLLLRCTHRGINWESMHDAYLASFATVGTADHDAMGVAASEALRAFASQSVVMDRLQNFLSLGLFEPADHSA